MTSGGIFELDSRRSRIEELEKLMEAQDFWDHQEKAREAIDEVNGHKSWVNGWEELSARLSDLEELKALSDEEGDEETLVEVHGELSGLLTDLENLELKHMLGDREDRSNAILTIHPGAGGTEAQDWAQMLMRMYSRWSERKGFKTDTLDLMPGETAGIKSATLEIDGEYAFGYLKAEIGVHRLVRISPFDSNNRRHTSFASVFVYPETSGDIEVDIKPEDLRVDTYRAGGAGGQHVNKTDSAVRMTHIPTGISVQCQNERSQHKNRNSALKILKARLYQYYREQEEEKKAELESGKKKIEWGSQIRNYVFQPQQNIKDVRTGLETSDIQGVMDGKIDDFIKAFLVEYNS
ncbi:MAG: peptide chain release factor 2 [Gemmatimonadetes bacterium]|nr:peptide chain release factor 2 [Gemmatimonadota bacterium]|tara:strand:- start:948 stop:1997 length:1050 start_codon:yes stop_codon:yes gene_type:complete